MDFKRMTPTIAEVSEDTLALETYLRGLPVGALVSYAEIARDAGVPMDGRGKARLRVASKRAQRVYTTIRGFGLKLSDAFNSLTIIQDRLVRVDNSVKRAETTTQLVLSQHREEMQQEDRRQAELVSMMFANVRAISNQRKRELRQARAKLAAALGIEAG